MSRLSFTRHPGTPSTRRHAGRNRQKVSTTNNTVTSSATPSPAPSTEESHLSVDNSTSISDLDDYTETLTPDSVRSAGMKLHPANHHNNGNIKSSDNRRSSGRLRKPTAKARALSEDIDSSSSQILESDTIVIGGSPTKKDVTKIADGPAALDSAPSTQEGHVHVLEDGGEMSTRSGANAAHPDGSPDGLSTSSVLQNSPMRRSSARERKPTQKVLEIESPTTKKRPAPEVEEPRPTKILRLSINEPKMPSKLRFSLTSASADLNKVGTDTPRESKEIATDSSPTQSKIIRLAIPKLGAWLTARNVKKAETSKNKLSTRRKSRRSELQGDNHSQVPVALAEDSSTANNVAKPVCSLSCLSDSQRLFAMAQIAALMPDSDEEEEDTMLAGSERDWRTWASKMCRCENPSSSKTSRTNSVELQLALEPNRVTTQVEEPIVSAPTPRNPDVEMLQAPVNVILRVDDAQRAQEIFANMNDSATFTEVGPPKEIPAHTQFDGRISLSAPRARKGQLEQARKSRDTPWGTLVDWTKRSKETMTPAHSPPAGLSSSVPARKTYEDRLRDDYRALADIRKKATSKGIHWSFNMTFDDIHGLLMDLEVQEEEQADTQQNIAATTLQRSDSLQSIADRSTPSFYPSLGLPPTPSSSHENGETSTRPRSSSRAKSSHFRVDPRGLLGESPGPGTIINIAEKKRKGSRVAWDQVPRKTWR